MDDDRTTKARLRDAAVELVAEGGTKALSARAVADRAGLSQGLIRHHFGSMAALLRECDAHVAEQIREGKEQVLLFDLDMKMDDLAANPPAPPAAGEKKGKAP